MEYNITNTFELNNHRHCLHIYRNKKTYIVDIDKQDQQTIQIGFLDGRVDYQTTINQHNIGVRIGAKIKIAIDGFYIESGHPYQPLQPLPLWTHLFLFFSLLIPIYDHLFFTTRSHLDYAKSPLLALSISLFIINSIICININRNHRETGYKVTYCSLSTLSAWAIMFIIMCLF